MLSVPSVIVLNWVDTCSPVPAVFTELMRNIGSQWLVEGQPVLTLKHWETNSHLRR